MKTVRDFAAAHADKNGFDHRMRRFLCSAVQPPQKTKCQKNVVAPYIDFELMDRLQQKELFYRLCREHDIDFPDTLVFLLWNGSGF